MVDWKETFDRVSKYLDPVFGKYFQTIKSTYIYDNEDYYYTFKNK